MNLIVEGVRNMVNIELSLWCVKVRFLSRPMMKKAAENFGL